jgi:hypothetical protein
MERLLLFGTMMMALAGCQVAAVPVRMDTDARRQQQEKTREEVAQGNIEAFIAGHPDLDEKTKYELRKGTVSVHEVLDRLKNLKPPQ